MFFPEEWSRQRVLDEVDGGWQNATVEGHRWHGVSPSGVTIKGWLTRNGTGYLVVRPDYREGRRTEEWDGTSNA